MTVAELLGNEELRRHEFPVAKEHIYLGHAGVCPLPRRVAEAIQRYGTECTRADQEAILPAKLPSRSRELAARILNVQPDEIAFVGPTSLGLSAIASGLNFRKGDNIVIYFDDYPSNVYPWMALAEKGVQVRMLNAKGFGRIHAVDVESQVDENTRLVALGSCHFVGGWRIDVGGIGQFLRRRNIAFSVDGIQTAGAYPTPFNWADFMAADAHKWLLGPCAAGILYVRKEWQDQVRPTSLGWNNVRCPNYVAQEELVFPKDARRYEAGTGNWFGLVGLNASMEMLLEFGIEDIAAELLRKRAWLVPALQQKGYTVVNADMPPENASAIISFHKPGADMAPVHQKLADAKIVTSLRADRAGNRYIRLSPHFYNTDAELHRVLELL
ncbi:MAG TPA: aminotransferase class V-fold PLP-dependent enzyme [Verrucomicrobiae bacterium]|nr:aminotransferase class V-fold PLP-dependent enzyme [Verrucomicrobiae bacterium]